MVVELILTTKGFDQAQQRLRAINKARIVKSSKFFTIKRIQESIEKVRDEVPVGDTGFLRSTVNVQVSESGDQLIATATADAFYAPWVHGGTGIYGKSGEVIIPQRARMLVFFWSRENKWMRVRSVRGQRANPFLRRGLKLLREKIKTTLPKEVRRDIQLVISGGGTT